MREVRHRSRGFFSASARWPRLLAPTEPVAPYGYDFTVHDLRIDDDIVCPRCLEWIEPHEFVRRTAYGPAQHEACPRPRM